MKVVDDRLLIRVVAAKEIGVLEANQNLEDAPCCLHLKCSNQFRRLVANTISDSVPAYISVQSKIYRCNCCPSESRVTVSRCNNDGDVVTRVGRMKISMSRYIDVERCESIESREWSALATTRMRWWQQGSMCPVNIARALETQFERV